MLVVNDHRLAAVNILDLAQQVFLSGFFATDTQDVIRIKRAVHQCFTGFDLVTLVDAQVLALGHSVLGFLDHFAAFSEGANDDRPLATFAVAKFHDTFDLTHHRGLFRASGFKEFGHTGQTTGDVLGTGRGPGRLGKQGSLTDFGTVFNFQISLLRHRIDRQGLALGILNGQLRVQIALVLDDLSARSATAGIPFDPEGLALHQVLEMNRSFEFRDDRHGVRVPSTKNIARRYLLAFFDLQGSTGGNRILVDVPIAIVGQGDHTVPVENQDVALLAVLALGLHHAQALETDLAVTLDLTLGLLDGTTSCTTNVERPHGELSARLTNGLSRDDANGQAALSQLTSR